MQGAVQPNYFEQICSESVRLRKPNSASIGALCLSGAESMANALVVRRTQLPRSQTTLRAAQYVRMSTDYQRYSIENQAAVIAAYAQAHNLAIVRTYADKGESGLRLRNRL